MYSICSMCIVIYINNYIGVIIAINSMIVLVIP